MSTYSLAELLHKWVRSDITTEQAIGYVIQNMMLLSDRQSDTEKRLRRLEQAVNANPDSAAGRTVGQ